MVLGYTIKNCLNQCVNLLAYILVTDPRSCRDRPCFYSPVYGDVDCTDVPLSQAYNPDLLPFLDIVKTFRCGSCPPGFDGDGETCDGERLE